MTFYESSTRTPLSAAAEDEDQDDKNPAAGPDEDEDDDDRGPALPVEGSIVEHLVEQIDDINLARKIDEQTLSEIGVAVMAEYRLDEQSRQEWLDDMETGMKLALQKAEPKSFPWPKASNTIFPLISKAAIQFGTVAYPAIIQGRRVVKGIVWGEDDGTPATKDGKPLAPDGSNLKAMQGPDGKPQPVWLVAPGEKRQRADRIGEHMSWQLLSDMEEWEPQTDTLLHTIPVTGGAVKKTYRDEVEQKNCSLLVDLRNLVWDYRALSFRAAPRHTELLLKTPEEIYVNEHVGRDEDSDEGMWLHLDYGPAGGGDTEVKDGLGETISHDAADPDAPHIFVEQHRRWDLDGDDYPEPYIVTVHARSQKVVRIVTNYDKDGIRATEDGEEIVRIKPVEVYTLIPFLPNIEGGSYPMGFGHYLRHLNEGIDTTLNQMFDAGTLQNAGGGFVGDQLGVPSGQINFRIGQFVRVTTKGQDIRASVFPMPFQGPSPVLFQLLGVLLEAGKDMAALQSVLAGDAAVANAPPTTILALIEQGMKFYTAIHKRIYRAIGQEFAKLYRLNRLHMKDAERYQVGDEWREIQPEDYRLGGGVEPVADPDMVTDMQKLGRGQFLLSFKDDPRMDGAKIIARVLESANIERPQELFAQPNPMAPQLAQLEMQMKTAELGRVRAAEQKDQTQAFLNLAMARAKSTEPEVAWIESQLEVLRLHIEAVNATTRSAMVDHAFHDSRSKGLLEHAKLAMAMAAGGPGGEGGGPEPPPVGAVVPPTPTPGPGPAIPAEPPPSGQLVGEGVPANKDE